MYPARFDDLGPAIRMGAVDIVLTDLHYWEGPRGKDLEAVCRTFNLGVAMHSGASSASSWPPCCTPPRPSPR